MMNRITWLFCVLVLAGQGIALGQNVDYNKIILPESSGSEIDISEKLVRLAWKNNPANRIVEKESEIQKLNEKKVKRGLLDALTVVANANEFNINPSADLAGRADFFPRYNIGLRISLATVFSQSLDNEMESYRVSQSFDDINAQKLKIREDVLKKYNLLKMHEEIFRIDEATLQDAELNHNLIEEKFKVGEESYERYITSVANLNRIKVSKIRSETEYFNVKLELEALIGVKLEDVY